MKKPIITIFGSSHPLEGDQEYQIAYELGKRLATEGYYICNGGYGGTMEATARGAHDGGGMTIGIIAEQFSRAANKYIDKVISVKTHTDRLLMLIETGDAFIVLRGITGTLAELAIVWEYSTKGFIKEKPIILLGEYWKPVVETIRREFHSEGLHKMAEFPNIAQNTDECIEYLNRSVKAETL